VTPRPLTIAVLVKQVPRGEVLSLGADHRLVRTGLEMEMNPYCRRAVSKGVELARVSGGRCVVLTRGPPAAEDCLREAVAWGADEGVLVSDPAFAGSDTLATAHALAAALRREGPFDVILTGRNSIDADTAQTPPQIAELLDLPMAAGVRRLAVGDETLEVHCEHDDGWLDARLAMPALLSCAERLAQPAKAGPEERAAVPAARIRRLNAATLGLKPSQAAGATVVGEVRRHTPDRLRVRLSGEMDAQVERAMAVLAEHGAFEPAPPRPVAPVLPPSPLAMGDPIAVLVEPGRKRATRELLGAAARLASVPGGLVVALACAPVDPATAGSWGADVIVPLQGAETEEDVAAAFAAWCAEEAPWAVLAPSTMWGREVAGRMSARLGAGLVGDAVDLAPGHNGRLSCWKPAFNGGLVAEVTCRTHTQMATVRSGVLPLCAPRTAIAWQTPPRQAAPRHRTQVLARTRDDDLDTLATADAVLVAGAGVPPEDYPLLDPLLRCLGAELAATRKVTDQGWQPRARQIGITGRSVAPRLFVTVGVSGKFNHVVGARKAGLILAINNDPAAPIFEAADVGMVADWRQAVPRLTDAVLRMTSAVASSGEHASETKRLTEPQAGGAHDECPAPRARSRQQPPGPRAVADPRTDRRVGHRLP
jgi:electron transfer flavoprotein alpha subunit